MANFITLGEFQKTMTATLTEYFRNEVGRAGLDYAIESATGDIWAVIGSYYNFQITLEQSQSIILKRISKQLAKYYLEGYVGNISEHVINDYNTAKDDLQLIANGRLSLNPVETLAENVEPDVTPSRIFKIGRS